MKKVLAVITLLILFFATRFAVIKDIPPSVYWDEASIGYNAYSILLTGKDEWGDKFPVHFRAFGEFKLPVYVYSVVPFVKLLGLNQVSVRIPAIIFSLISLVFIYLITNKLLGSKNWGLMSAFFVIVSPWYFIFSRTGYEATAGLAFYLAGLYFLYYPRRGLSYLFGIVFWILSIYSYNAFRILIPLTGLFIFIKLIFQGWKNIKKDIVFIGLSVIIFATSLTPIIRVYKYDSGAVRLNTISTTNPVQLVKNYFSHYSPEFLLIRGDTNARSAQPGWGEIYWIEVPLILLGIFFAFKNKKWLPLLLLVIAPIPAAITRESPHALRSILTPMIFSFLSVFGIYQLTKIWSKYYLFIIGLTIGLLYLSFESYLTSMYLNYNKNNSQAWQYGYSEIFNKYKDDFSNYGEIIISDSYAQPYIFALFYLQYDPNLFVKTVKYNSPDKWGFSTVKSFGNFIFEKPFQLSTSSNKKLIFATPEDGSLNLPKIDEIKFLDGSTAFNVYKLGK